MAARRLLIVMLVLLFVSTLAAALVPPRERDEQTGSGTASAPESQPATTNEEPAGRALAATVDADSKRVDVVRLRAGDRLSLLVRYSKPDQVEIPAFGQISAVDPDAPARFDILAEEPGRFRVRLLQRRRVAAVIEVSKPGAGKRRKGRKSG
jgi:hypothetical protein